MKIKISVIGLLLLLTFVTPAGAVIGGKPAKEGNYPYLVDLLECSGTLIAPDRILTAAHCVEPIFEESGAAFFPLALGSKLTLPPKSLENRIISWTVHPKFSHGKSLSRYDVAILQLEHKVNVKPLRLSLNTPKGNAKMEVVGRGWIRYFGNPPQNISQKQKAFALNAPRKLYYASLKRAPDWYCRAYYRNYRTKKDAFSSKNMLCAIDAAYPKKRNVKGARYRSPCLGDSGGPLLVRQKGRLSQAGVVSGGASCGAIPGEPSVFAKVPALRSFIRDRNPTWSPVAKSLPVIQQEGNKLTCLPPADWESSTPVKIVKFRWSRLQLASDHKTVLKVPISLDGKKAFTGKSIAVDVLKGAPGVCQAQARNSGGASFSPPSEPLILNSAP